jgi:hypothetical protein
MLLSFALRSPIANVFEVAIEFNESKELHAIMRYAALIHGDRDVQSEEIL